MDTLPPELWNLMAGGDLRVFDKLRATSKLVAAFLTEPPLLFDGAPIDNYTGWDERTDYRKITRGAVNVKCYVGFIRRCVIYESDLKTATRVFRGYNGPAPIFLHARRILPGPTGAALSASPDPRNIMLSGHSRRRIYAFDVNIWPTVAFVHVSNMGIMLSSGQWKFDNFCVLHSPTKMNRSCAKYTWTRCRGNC